MFLSIPAALLLTVAAPIAEQAAEHAGHGHRPVSRRGSRRRRAYRPDEMGRPDLLPPRPRQAGRRRRSGRRHQGHRQLGRRAEGGRCEGPVPVVRTGRHSRPSHRGGTAGGWGRRHGDRHGSLGRSAEQSLPMAGYRDDPGLRRRRHACRPGPHPRRSSPRLGPNLLAAMAAGGDTSIQIAIVPSTTLRRSIEESLAVLPEELGGGPITTLTRGLSWISLTFGVRTQAGDPRGRAGEGPRMRPRP